MNILAVGEFIVSDNFFLLLTRLFNLPNSFIELGAYQQGIPIRPVADFVWGSNSGLRTLPILASLSLLQKVFPTTWDYLYLFITIILSFITFLLAIRIIKKINVFIILGAIFYCGNLWIIDRLFSGFWQLNFVYAFVPFLITIPLKIVSKRSWTIYKFSFWTILYALLASIIITAQPHFLIMVSIFSLIHIAKILLKKDYLHTSLLISFYCFSILFFLLMNLYHIVPSILYPERLFTAPNQYFSINAVASNGAHSQLYNVLRLETVWYYPVTEFKWTILEYFQLIPIFITLLLFIFNKKRSWIYAVCLLIFIFFAKALHTPGENISRWIYQHIFFMHFFRDPSRFLGGMALFMSLIIADFTFKKAMNRVGKIALITISLCVIIIINFRNISHPRIDTLYRSQIPASYIQLQQFVTQNLHTNLEGRALPLPDFQGVNDYSWYTDPLPLSNGTVFDMLIPLQLPLVSTVNYPDSLSNQITAFLYQKYITGYDNQELAPLAVRYLITDTSPTKIDATRKIATESGRILSGNTTDYQILFHNQNVSMFENKKASSLVTTQKPLFAIGNLDTIAKSYESGSTRPVILLNQMVNSSIKDLSILKNEDIIIDLDNPTLVLAAERLTNKYNVDILKAGWDYDKIFYNFEPSKMIYIQNNGELFTSGRAVASATTGFMHVAQQVKKGKYRILLKALSESSPSQLTINLGGATKSISITTNKHLKWIDGGVVDVTYPSSFITLTKPDGNFVVVDQLVVVPETRFVSEEQYVNNVFSHMNIVSTFLPTDQQKEQYQLQEDRVLTKQPSKYLTYRYSYGDYWESDKPSIKFMSDLYGMTFIANNGKLTRITYFPNIIYKFSLFISGLLVIFIVYFIISSLYYMHKLSYLHKRVK